jgi:hypothetical protein
VLLVLSDDVLLLVPMPSMATRLLLQVFDDETD